MKLALSKIWLIFLVSFCLFGQSLASVLPCQMLANNQPVQVQLSQTADMPCHQEQQTQQATMQDCQCDDNCQCSTLSTGYAIQFSTTVIIDKATESINHIFISEQLPSNKLPLYRPPIG